MTKQKLSSKKNLKVSGSGRMYGAINIMVLLFLLGERRKNLISQPLDRLISRRPQPGTNELQILVLTIDLQLSY